MTKAEVKEAILATIKSNGNKAITADSLANLLIEILENGGGGNGVPRVWINSMDSMDGNEAELTPEQLAENADTYKTIVNGAATFVTGAVAMEEDGITIVYAAPFKVVCFKTQDETMVMLSYQSVSDVNGEFSVHTSEALLLADGTLMQMS